MTTLLRGTVALLMLGAAAQTAQAQGGAKPNLQEQTLYSQLQAGGTQATTAVNTVLKKSTTTPSVLLFMASAVAMKAQRLEDGAYLFYVAQWRRRFDEAAFPFKGQASQSPSIALGALSNQIGQVVNPTVMAQPVVFKNVLARMRPWEPQIPAGYWPGWAVTAPAATASARALHSTNKRQTLKIMGDTATLLSIPEYLQNFRLVQSYNLKSGTTRPTAAQFEAAKTRLAAIEREKNIAGPFTIVARGR